jgi:flagellum-specific peptidoglycan hydrolase FlgJ
MFRLIAILGVVAAFGGTLYFGGDRLEAWESPQAAVEEIEASDPGSKRKAKSKRRSHATRKAKRRNATWLVKLNALCRRGQDATDSIRPPTGPADSARFLRDFARLNGRLNDQAAELVQRSGNAKAARQLRKLFDQDEALIRSILTAAQKGQERKVGNLLQSLVAVAKSENRLLGRLGAIDCTVSPNLFRL